MNSKTTELTAYCGLYCGDCNRYKSKAAVLARDLLSELQDTQFAKYAEYKSGSAKQFDPVQQFEHFQQCCETLQAIVDLQCNQPCRLGEGCSTFSCGILRCCRRKGYQGCWECSDFEECAEFEFLETFHDRTPVMNLRKIKELGPDKWADYRHKFYIWQ